MAGRPDPARVGPLGALPAGALRRGRPAAGAASRAGRAAARRVCRPRPGRGRAGAPRASRAREPASSRPSSAAPASSRAEAPANHVRTRFVGVGSRQAAGGTVRDSRTWFSNQVRSWIRTRFGPGSNQLRSWIRTWFACEPGSRVHDLNFAAIRFRSGGSSSCCATRAPLPPPRPGPGMGRGADVPDLRDVRAMRCAPEEVLVERQRAAVGVAVHQVDVRRLQVGGRERRAREDRRLEVRDVRASRAWMRSA